MSDGKWPSGSHESGPRIFTDAKKSCGIVSGLLLLVGIVSLAGCAALPLSPLFSTYVARQDAHDGVRWKEQRDYDHAEAALLESLRFNSQDAETWNQLGLLYLRVEDLPKARAAFEVCLKHQDNHEEAQSGLWAVHLLEGGYSEPVRDEVRQEIERILSQEKVDVHRLLAAYQGYTYLHDSEAARLLVPKILQERPPAETIQSLSQSAAEDVISERDLNRKVTLMEQYVNSFPPGPWKNLVYAVLLRTLVKDIKDIERMRAVGERWIQETPQNRIAYATIGTWYLEAETDLDWAAATLKKALVLIESPDPIDRPEEYPADLWLRDLEETKGRYHERLGWIDFKLGKRDEAEREFQRASQYLPWDHRLYTHWGQLQEDLGHLATARAYYLRAMEAGNELPEAEGGLRRLYALTQEVGHPDAEGGEPSREAARQRGVVTFTDVTRESGLAGLQARRVAWGDFDRDGFDDLLLNGWILMRNQGDGTFVDSTQGTQITNVPGANGGVWADFNNDGFLDFYLTASGPGTWDRWMKNRGDGTFEDVTGTAVPDQDRNREHAEAAAWGDYDRDGFVDLYVANYEIPLLSTIERAIGTPHRLYHNNGDGTFSDRSRESGIMTREKMVGRGVAWADYNNDGALDIFVSDYRLDPNLLWQNNKKGQFREVGRETGTAGSGVKGYFGHTIGSVWGDYDNDGDLDLVSANLAHPRYIGFSNKSMLLENLGPPEYHFIDRFSRSGIRYEETHADPSFADVDNDGFLDLYLTSTYEKKNSFLYRGNGDGTFTDLTYLSGVRVTDGWGNAFADIDHDGDLDLIVGGGEGVRLFRNDGSPNSWLQVQVVGKTSNRSGIGARVVVRSAHARQIREIEGGKGTGSQNSMTAAFGFGQEAGAVQVEVRFPSGRVVHKSGVALNQRIQVAEE